MPTDGIYSLEYGLRRMAGDWIKMRVWIEKDPKTISMAEYLASDRRFMQWLTDPVQQSCSKTAYEHVTRDVTVRLTVTGLLRVWGVSRELGRRNDTDLVLNHASLDTLEEISGIAGFGDAMAFVGWARETGKGEVIFPNYLSDNECLEDRQREQHIERQRRYRERKRAERQKEEGKMDDGQGGATRDVTVAQRVTPVTVTSRARTRESSSCSSSITTSKSKKEGTKEFLPDTVPLPFSGKEFQRAWAKWCENRREIKKPLTPTCCSQQLAWCEKVGKDRAVAALEHTIRQGWVGIREEEENKQGSKKREKPTVEEIIGVRHKKNDD